MGLARGLCSTKLRGDLASEMASGRGECGRLSNCLQSLLKLPLLHLSHNIIMSCNLYSLSIGQAQQSCDCHHSYAHMRHSLMACLSQMHMYCWLRPNPTHYLFCHQLTPRSMCPFLRPTIEWAFHWQNSISSPRPQMRHRLPPVDNN
jgi:hypothetical protein